MSQQISEVRAKRALPIAVIAVGALAAGALAACGSSSSTAQTGGIGAASVLPANAFAFASLDVEPADGEKGQLLGTLLKFPAIAKNVKIGPSDDVRAKIFEQILKNQPKGCGMTYAADFQPWLGTQVGVAGVVEAGQPTAAVAVQITDEAKAKAAVAKLSSPACDDSKGAKKVPAIAYSGGWAIGAQDQKTLDAVMAQTAQGSLANDANFKKWTAKTGGPGFATVYAGPSLGGVIDSALKKMVAASGSFSKDFNKGLSAGLAKNPLASICPNQSDPTKAMDQLGAMLSGFQGGALTVRAKNAGVEIEGDVDTSFAGSVVAGTATGDLTKLPANTAAAVSFAPPQNFWDQIMTQLGKSCGPSFDRAKVEAGIAQMTGLSVPGDLNTLLGKSLTLALGGGTNLLTAFTQPATAPVALLLNGDSGAIQSVVSSLLTRTGASAVFSSKVAGDDVVLSPKGSSFASTVTSGGLGNDPAFQDVVPNAGNSPVVLYVNFNQLQASFGSIPQKVLENLKVLKALGISAQYSGSDAHLFIRLSTN